MSILARRVLEPSANSPARILREEIEVLLDASVPPGAVPAGRGQGDVVLVGDIGAPVLAYLLVVEVVDVGVALLDYLDGEVVQLLVVVRGVVLAVLPVVAEPGYILLDRLDVGHVLLLGIRVVEAEVALPAELLGYAEVDAEGLGVADVEPAVGLGRIARHHVFGAAAREVLGHRLADEIVRLDEFWAGVSSLIKETP